MKSLGWYMPQTSFDNQLKLGPYLLVRSLSRVSKVYYSWLCSILRDRGNISRRLKLALFGLTILPLSQAWPLGNNCIMPHQYLSGAAISPPALHPPDATPQRLIVYLYRQWGFPPISSLRFVAHVGSSLYEKIDTAGEQFPAGPRSAHLKLVLGSPRRACHRGNNRYEHGVREQR